MRRIDFTTSGSPIRQTGSLRFPVLNGLQNLSFKVAVSFDDVSEFWQPMAPMNTPPFARMVLFVYERPSLLTENTEHADAKLMLNASGVNGSECAAFVPVSVSFFQYLAGVTYPIRARLGFDDGQGNVDMTTIARQYHIGPA